MLKKKAGIVLVIVLAALVILPIAIYGTNVDVAQVSLGLSVSSPLATASLSDIDSKQAPVFNVGLTDVDVDVTTMNPYEYMLARNTGRTQVSGDDDQEGAIVEITITFNLTTPANTSLVFVLTPGSLRGTGAKEVMTLLGPEDGLTTGGEFHLTITIAVKVTPPGFDNPVVDLTLEPVSRTFTVPQSG